MLSVGDIYARPKAFQSRIPKKGWTGRKLYFVKVDISSCFDTIQQKKKLIGIIKNILTEESYRIARHAEIKLVTHAKKVVKKFLSRAGLEDDFERFENFAKTMVEHGNIWQTAVVDNVVHRY